MKNKYEIHKEWVDRNRERYNAKQREYYRKKRKQAISEGKAKRIWFTEEEKQYIKDHYLTMSSFEIAMHLNCHTLKVSRWINAHGLKPLRVHRWTERNARWLMEEYYGKRKTTEEIAQMIGIKPSSVRTLVRNLSIKYNMSRNEYKERKLQGTS